jgi:hypothetical protein
LQIKKKHKKHYLKFLKATNLLSLVSLNFSTTIYFTKMNKYIAISFLLIVTACNKKQVPPPESTRNGYKPIYKSYDQIRKIENLGPQKLKNPGKIYKLGNYLFINEIGEGIHIYNNTDNKKPVNISFISIPANKDISIKNNILYADNADDLVAIDISDAKAAILVKRIERAFPYPSYPIERGFFECVDPTRGYVVSWVFTELKDPKCSR